MALLRGLIALLQLLRTYVDKEFDWEQHLPLALYAYRTEAHSSTGISHTC